MLRHSSPVTGPRLYSARTLLCRITSPTWVDNTKMSIFLALTTVAISTPWCRIFSDRRPISTWTVFTEPVLHAYWSTIASAGKTPNRASHPEMQNVNGQVATEIENGITLISPTLPFRRYPVSPSATYDRRYRHALDHNFASQADKACRTTCSQKRAGFVLLCPENSQYRFPFPASLCAR
jgi:hypothetical protein